VVAAAVLVILCAPAITNGMTTPNAPSTSVRFAWLFGYDGDSFVPQVQLGLSQSTVLGAVAQISSAVGGKSNLDLVSVVDESPGQIIQTSMYPTVSAYVSSLHQYAQSLFGRIDLAEFNQTSAASVYGQVGKYVVALGLDGIFFDHAAAYYKAVGQDQFNAMMQNLTTSYPAAKFILNNANAATVIVPVSGNSWAANSYVSPSVDSNSYDQFSVKLIGQMSAVWPERVILHLDSWALRPAEPMGVFAKQSSKTEESAVSYMASTGLSNDFYLLYPVLGAWTCSCSNYKGTLYNSLAVGTYARGTITSFIHTMQQDG
jgi:hypothetical protein